MAKALVARFTPIARQPYPHPYPSGPLGPSGVQGRQNLPFRATTFNPPGEDFSRPDTGNAFVQTRLRRAMQALSFKERVWGCHECKAFALCCNAKETDVRQSRHRSGKLPGGARRRCPPRNPHALRKLPPKPRPHHIRRSRTTPTCARRMESAYETNARRLGRSDTAAVANPAWSVHESVCRRARFRRLRLCRFRSRPARGCRAAGGRHLR